MKRGIWLLLIIIIALPVFADLPVSEEEAVAAIAKPSTVKFEVTCAYEISYSSPVVRDGQLFPGKVVESREHESRVGSGFIVSENGYILTNAHVVAPFEDLEFIELFHPVFVDMYGLESFDDAVVKEYLEDHLRVLGKETERAMVRVPSHSPSMGVYGKMYPVDIKRVGAPFPGNDLAVVKIDADNLPALELGTTTHLSPGNRVVVIGFPKATEIGGAFEATVTSGIISAVKETSEDERIIQMDAATETGNSGGPVLDSSGKVVGVDVASWKFKQGFNYFVPAEAAREFLSDAFVLPEQGVVKKVYERALVHFWNGRYENAIDDFRAVQDIYPDHPYAPVYLTRARLALEQEEPGDYSVIFLSVGAALVLLVIVLFLVILYERHRIEVLQRR